jgi:hypothetical protein
MIFSQVGIENLDINPRVEFIQINYSDENATQKIAALATEPSSSRIKYK